MNVKFVAMIAGVNGPVGENEREAVVRLREYMESYLGQRHFLDVNPEGDYQSTLFQLYSRESGENSEETFSGPIMKITNEENINWSFDEAIKDFNLNCRVCHIGNLSNNLDSNKCPFCNAKGCHTDIGWEFDCGCFLDNCGRDKVSITKLCGNTEEGKQNLSSTKKLKTLKISAKLQSDC